MTRILPLLAALAALAGATGAPVLAADLSAKAMGAATLPSCTNAMCSGWYLGGGIEGAGPIATGQADLTNGAGINIHGGYQLWNGSWFAAAEVGATGYFGASTFTPLGGSTVSPGRWSVDYLAKGGYGLQGLFSAGNTTTPSQGLFANLNANLISPCVIVGGRTRQFGTGFVSGGCIEYAIGNGWNVGVEYLNVNYNTSVGSVSIGHESSVALKFNRMF
jgi:hypothetical protein